jgi:hypothetical protein
MERDIDVPRTIESLKVPKKELRYFNHKEHSIVPEMTNERSITYSHKNIDIDITIKLLHQFCVCGAHRLVALFTIPEGHNQLPPRTTLYFKKAEQAVMFVEVLGEEKGFLVGSTPGSKIWELS